MGGSAKRPKPKLSQPAGKQNVNAKGQDQQPPGAAVEGDRFGSLRASETSTLSAEKVQPPHQQESQYKRQRQARREEARGKMRMRVKQREAERRQRLLKKWGWVSGSSLLMIGLLAWLGYQLFSGPGQASYLTGAPIDGIACDRLEQTAAHYHVHLSIFVDGEPVEIPAGIGLQAPGCLYWLHVHGNPGDEGVIHVEAPVGKTFHLFQFFDIWGQSLSKTNLVGNQVDAGHPLTMYVFAPNQDELSKKVPRQPFTVNPPTDPKQALYTGDPRQILLLPDEVIALEYGMPILPPQPFIFRPGE